MHQYDIEIAYSCSSAEGKMLDTIDALDLIDAYDKAHDIVEKLNAKIDRDSAFSIVKISRHVELLSWKH